jgi:hypothetical protein
LTIGFIKRAELLPPGETLEQHVEWQKEHAEIVQRDKASIDVHTGGLFRGYFKIKQRRHAQLAVPIRDPIDGVTRCPYCHWEIEDDGCPHCGLPFDENGTGSWDDSPVFHGYTTSEEPSENGAASVPGYLHMDPDYDDNDGFDEMAPDYDEETGAFNLGTDQYMQVEPHFTMQRYISSSNNGSSTAGSGSSLRGAFHSAAGSRRRSYSASHTSDYADTEMGTLEEEDEEDEEDSSSMRDYDDEDDSSSMRDFIGDDTEDGSQSSSSAAGERESVPPPRSRLSSVHDDVDDDDDEDAGPVAPPSRRRRRADSNTPTPSQSQPSQRRRLRGHMSPSSGSQPTGSNLNTNNNNMPSRNTNTITFNDNEGAARRPRQTMQRSIPSSPTVGDAASASSGGPISTAGGDWRWGYTPLGRESQEADMEADDESDGTTVGWEPNTNSTDRSRNGGSLTPTAGRPIPPVRPSSRVGNSRLPLGARGLRRRSSVLSTSTTHYEDNDADDDGSSVDEDGDSNMASPLRSRTSRIFRPSTQTSSAANFSQQQGFGDGVAEVDSDDTDLSGRSYQQARLTQNRQREYDPRISFLFAQHHQDLRENNHPDPSSSLGPLDQLRGLTRTPVARPRTANRNRIPNPGVVQTMQSSPGSVSRLTPNGQLASRARNSAIENQAPHGVVLNSGPGSERIPSATRTSQPTGLGEFNAAIGQSSPTSRQSGVPISPTPSSLASFGDSIGRPESRVSHRPPSAAGRRNALPTTSQFASMGPGLNTRSQWQNRNPFFNPIRPRTSNARLREQSSTATLRPQASNRTLRGQQSRTNIRNGAQGSPQIRPQASRMHLPSQSPQPVIPVQAPVRTQQPFAAQLRQQTQGTAGHLPLLRHQVQQVSSMRPSTAEDQNARRETERRARALVEQRREDLARMERSDAASRREELAAMARNNSIRPMSMRHITTAANPFVQGQRPASQHSISSSSSTAMPRSSVSTPTRPSVPTQNTPQSSMPTAPLTSQVIGRPPRTTVGMNSAEPSVLTRRGSNRTLPPNGSFVPASSLHSANQTAGRPRIGMPLVDSNMRTAVPRGAAHNTSPSLISRA